MKQQTRGSLMLLLCAMVWGAAFVAQSEGMNYVGPFTMQATRYFLSGLVLLPVIALRDKKGISVRPAGKAAKRQLLCGVICGALLCTASIIQQYGIIHTTVGKSGFITTMYIILVPFLGLFVKLRVKLMNWVCAVLALTGLYLLCAGGEGLTGVNYGDWLTLLCAIFFACHILFIDRTCHDLDGVRLSCVQFFTASALSILPMLLLEKPSLAAVTSAWLPIVYAGVFSGGIGYTLQIFGQQRLDAAPAEDAMRKGKPVQEVGVFGSDEFGVAIRKDDAETMKLVNEGYKLLKADPYWKELQAKYLGNK